MITHCFKGKLYCSDNKAAFIVHCSCVAVDYERTLRHKTYRYDSDVKFLDAIMKKTALKTNVI